MEIHTGEIHKMPADSTYYGVGSSLEGGERVTRLMVTNSWGYIDNTIRPNGLQVASGNEAVFQGRVG